MRKKTSQIRFAVFLILPAFLIVTSVIIFPLFFSFYASLTSYNILKPGSFKFIGFSNYIALIFYDPNFANAFINTLLFIVSALSLELISGLLVALLIFKQKRGNKIASLLALIPMMFAPALVGYQFKYFFNDQVGFLNNLLYSIGIKKAIPWLVDPILARLSILSAEIWVSTPFVTIVLLAGLMAIPNEPLEAAEVDGASPWQKFWYITLPLLSPYILIALTIRSLGISKAFDIIEIMTGGGPAYQTEMLWTYAYRKAITEAYFGKGCAIGYLSAVIGILLSLFLFWRLIKTRGQT